MLFIKKHIAVISIIALTLLTRLFLFGYPSEVVFDEVHFGKFASAYFTGEHYFDVHPPLGKLMIAGAGKILGYKSGFDFINIGEKFPDSSYLALRILPVTFGMMIPILVYLLARKLGISKLGSWLAGMMLVFENGFIVESRFILLNNFLIVFGLAGILAWLYAREKKSFWLYLLSAIFVAFSISIKWTGVAFLGIILLAEFILFLKNINWKNFLNYICILFGFLIVLAVLYFTFFAIHFALLPKQGMGDSFFPPSFKSESLIQKTIDTNVQMAVTQKRISGHPYRSSWYSWPMMQRPIYYWAGERVGDTMSRIYYLGNPIVYWLSSFGIFALFILFIFRKINNKYYFATAFVILGYLANFLPFSLITRSMFLYHYMSALVFAVLAYAILLEHLSERNKKIAIKMTVVLVVLSFLYFAPLTYGLNLSDEAYRNMLWLKSWI